VAGNGSSTPPAVGPAGGDGKLATEASIYDCQFVALDGAGNIYIMQPMFSWIRRVDAASGIITTWAGINWLGGINPPGSQGDGNYANETSLFLPWDVVTMPGGQVVIAEYGNNILRIVGCTTPSGAPSAAHDPQPWAAAQRRATARG
jgi:hypothetical protein